MTRGKSEIERKWLLSDAPDLSNSRRMKIIQGYVAVTSDMTEVRLRKQGRKYFETIKKGTGLRREEREVQISRKQFVSLWPATRGRRLEKVRHTLKWQSQKIEVDIYKKHLKGLMVAEVEFKSRREATAFSPPDWFGKEVTKNRRYKNVKLAGQQDAR